jgi:hypothetical protein
MTEYVSISRDDLEFVTLLVHRLRDDREESLVRIREHTTNVHGTYNLSRELVDLDKKAVALEKEKVDMLNRLLIRLNTAEKLN